MAYTIPGGRDKGLPLSEASDEALAYWIKRKADDLEKNPNGQYAENDRKMLAAMRSEVRAREGGAPAPDAKRDSGGNGAATRSIQRAPQTQLVGASLAEGEGVTAKLLELASQAHLVSPATACAKLPEGCEVAISVVAVDPDDSHGEVYPVGFGKFGLAKVALDRIGAAAGVTWDPDRCRRLDDGQDPRYVHFRAVGRVRNFDGSERVITGEKEMDLREGSAQLEALYERAKGRKADGSDRKDPTRQIREMRLHILSHAESKAKLRALRSLGIKTSFTQEELKLPFAVARLMWTGRTADPELRRMFAEKQADAMIGANAALYGSPPRQLPAQEAGHAAPPVGSVPADDSAYETAGTGTDDEPLY